MHLTSMQMLITLLAVALGTMITRFSPFLLFPENQEPPKFVTFLGKTLPAAMIGLLVVYCFRSLPQTSVPIGMPEALATVVIVILHAWRRNTLLSIGAGTALYIALQFAFGG